MERIEITPWFYYDVFFNGKRTIHVPSAELKKVQRFILKKYFKEYFIQKSVRAASLPHCNKNWLMKLDIKDFYNSVTEEQIKEIIYRYTNKDDAKNIFEMCTINGKLPTGAPTSPYIANLVLKKFDFDIYEFCKKLNVDYSRYMDDLFFSTDGKQYILSLVELEVLKHFKEYGFLINKDKIRYVSKNKQQRILGLGVNNKEPVLTKEDKRKYRSYFYNLIYPLRFNKQKLYEEHEKELLGHMAYIKSVDTEYYKRIKKYLYKLITRFNIVHKKCLKNLLKILI